MQTSIIAFKGREQPALSAKVTMQHTENYWQVKYEYEISVFLSILRKFYPLSTKNGWKANDLDSNILNYTQNIYIFIYGSYM